VGSLTLVIGDEELLVSRAVTHALAHSPAAGDKTDAADAHDLDAATAGADELVALLSPSLFDEPRLVVVRNLQDADKGLVAAIAEAGGVDDPGIAIVAVHAGGAKGKAALDVLGSAGAAVTRVTAAKSARDREQFATDEVRAAGGSLDRDAAVELVAAIGSDLRELATAAAQLVSDVGGQITADDVTTYFRGRAESTGFAVADRAVEGNAAKALETLRWAFATGVDPVLVSSSLAANLRLIAQVGAAGQGSPETVAARLRMPAWKVRRAQGWLRYWRPDALGAALQAVAVADADLKGAADDAAYAVERAVLRVAEASHAG
jgi:DNA polymerase III subunit delta